MGGLSCWLCFCSLALGSDWKDWTILPNAVQGRLYRCSLGEITKTPSSARWSLEYDTYEFSKSGSSSFQYVGQRVAPRDYSEYMAIDLPFAFPFYGNYYSTVYFDERGGIFFSPERFEESFGDRLFGNKMITRFPCILVSWPEMLLDGGEMNGMALFIDRPANRQSITIRWVGRTKEQPNGMVTLYRDGRIVMAYDAAYADRKYSCIGAGDGVRVSPSDAATLTTKIYTEDQVFRPVKGHWSLPSGLSLGADGMLRGVPTVPGSYNLHAIVTDADGFRHTKSFCLEVEETMPEAKAGESYSARLASGDKPTTWKTSYDLLVHLNRPFTSYQMPGDADIPLNEWRTENEYYPVDLPFDFPFFDHAWSRIYVCNDGTIHFTEDGALRETQLNKNLDGFEELVKRFPMIIVMCDKMDTRIYARKSDDSVVITWTGRHSTSWRGHPINISAELHRSGQVTVKFGPGNASGGFSTSSFSAGDSRRYEIEGGGGYFDELSDSCLIPYSLDGEIPPGLSISQDGRIYGTPSRRGNYEFNLLAEETTPFGRVLRSVRRVHLRVNGDRNELPVIDSTFPETGNVNIKQAETLRMSVSAHDPEGAPLCYRWFVDGKQSGTESFFDYRRSAGDWGFHTVRCEIADDIWNSGEVYAEWKVGVLEYSVPERVSVTQGGDGAVSVPITSFEPVQVLWYKENGEYLGEGRTLFLSGLQNPISVYALICTQSAGEIRTPLIAVTVVRKPSVGAIYKVTGPVLEGNRLVLRAKGFGAGPLTYIWEKDNIELPEHSECLDIHSVSSSDYGSYTFTVRNAYGSATTAPIEIFPEKGGAIVSAPNAQELSVRLSAGPTDVVQVAGGCNFCLTLDKDGVVRGWGNDEFGGQNVPIGLKGVNSITAGGCSDAKAAAAVLNNGEVVTWGKSDSVDIWQDEEDLTWYTNCYGYDIAQLPVDLSDVVQISIGDECAMTLNASGKVDVWGSEDFWVQEYMVQVPPEVHDVVSIATKDYVCMALRADGRVICWGDDNVSEEGEAPWFAPPAGALSGVKAIAIADNLCIAVKIDGSVVAWGDEYSSGAVADIESYSQVDSVYAGEYSFMLLMADGSTVDFSPGGDSIYIWDDEPMKPGYIKNALGASIGNFDCDGEHLLGCHEFHFLIVPDSDKDGVGDAEEIFYGRNPNVKEKSELVELYGFVKSSGKCIANAWVWLHAANEKREWNDLQCVQTDGNGRYVFSNVLPAPKYQIFVSADDYADVWYPKSIFREGAQTFPVEWNSRKSFHGPDFEMIPGQSAAYGHVVGDRLDPVTGEWIEDEDVSLPEGSVVYLDGYPVEMLPDGTFFYGEVYTSEEAPAMRYAFEHSVTVRYPENVSFIPSPSWEGEEGYVDDSYVAVSGPTGTICVETDPPGAEVFINYADKPFGKTPLTVKNLEAIADCPHTLLLRKDGYLRPRPIEVCPTDSEITVIHVPLVPVSDQSDALSVSVESQPSNLDVYVDYLPSGKVAPAVIGNLDGASHAGPRWTTIAHSILLRGKNVGPIMPRDVPEDMDTPQLEIVVPNFYMPTKTATKTTPVPVPYEWLKRYGLVHGENYEAAANSSGVNGRPVWQSYLIGLEPNRKTSVFQATIRMVDGKPKVEWFPNLGEKRSYTVLGKEKLTDSNWEPQKPWHRFFKIQVSMP